VSGRDKTLLAPGGQGRIPLWFKISYGAFLCVLVPVYWRHHGPANFLWASDIALFTVFAAACLENRLLNGMMAIGVMPFELAWIVDFLSGGGLIGVTGFMFDASYPLYLRGLSLFHLFLPLVIIYLLWRLGYDRRALPAQTLLTWVVLPASYLLTDPAENINFVFGPGREPQTWLDPQAYLALEMVSLPLLVCAPAHLLMKRLFGRG